MYSLYGYINDTYIYVHISTNYVSNWNYWWPLSTIMMYIIPLILTIIIGND